MEIDIEPGGLVAPEHVHTMEDETVFVAEGRIGVLLGGEVRYAEAGTAVFAPRDLPHTFWNAGKARAHVILAITPGSLERYFVGLGERGPEVAVDAIVAHAADFGMELRLASLPELVGEHGVTLM